MKELEKLHPRMAERKANAAHYRCLGMELKESEKRFRDLVENADIAILIDDEQGIVKYANKKAAELYGYSMEEIREQSIQSLVHPDDVKMVLKYHKDRIQGKEISSSYEFRGIKKDGSVRHLEISVSPIKEGKDKNGTRMYIKDITERKKTEKALKDSEERLKILYEYAPDGYYLNDLKGNFVDGNRAAEELTGYKKEELIGKNFLKCRLLSAKDIPKAVSQLAKNALGKPTGPDEFILYRKDGIPVAVDIRTHPVKIKGCPVVLGSVRDITERKKTEEQIKKSLEEKEVLLKEIHHRVKNNMQIISSMLKIQAGNIQDKETRDVFHALHGRIRSMSLLYKKLYQSNNLAKVDISEYLRNLTTHLVSMYRDRVGAINLKLDVKDVYLDLKKALPCGLIITELVSNSLKHAFSKAETGEIAVEMHPSGRKKYTLTVRDSGKGFPEGFDFQLTESFGMKLVVDLVRQLKGTIELNRGEGTEFKIMF